MIGDWRLEIGDFKEVLTRTIDADGFSDGCMPTDGIVRLERLAALEGDIRHLVKGSHTTDIKPFRQLLAGELLQPHSEGDFLQFS